MKQKLLIGLAIATMSFANMSHADYIFYSNSNSCDVVTGHWAGTGSASHWLVSCKYHGDGTVSAVDEKGHFTLKVRADKDSGSILCPAHTEEHVNGECVNGVITFKTEYGNLRGNFSQNTGTATGTLNVSAGINVDVDIEFNRKG